MASNQKDFVFFKGDGFNLLFEDMFQKIFMNSAQELFVQNKMDGTELRMSANKASGSIYVDTHNVSMRTNSYGETSGIKFSKV